MEQHVLIYLKAINVNVQQDSLDSSARMKSVTVSRELVLIGRCVKTCQAQETLNVSVETVSRVKIVTLQRIPALKMEIHVPILQFAELCHKEDTHVNVNQAGRVATVIKTLMTVLKNHVFSEEIALILSMTSNVSVQWDLLARDVKTRWTFVVLNPV